jgi:sugar lactone lactonase YvrE
MKRNQFIYQSLLTAGALLVGQRLRSQPQERVYGHNNKKYHLNVNWGKLDMATHPVNDCHEMVQDSRGRILLLTNETKNNLLAYDKSGKLLSAWGTEYPGAHGLTLQKNGKEDFLFITDTQLHQVYKTTMDGRQLLKIDAPLEAGIYTKKEEFVPTETTVLPNGEFYVADGYGLQYILHYDANGKLIHYFGGRGAEEKNLDNAHGLTVDTRAGTPSLLVTDRTRSCFKRFTLDGKLLDIIRIPGAAVCRPVIHGKYLYAAVLRSPNLDKNDSGFVTILNEKNQVVSNIGGTEPIYENGELKPLAQAQPIFRHPHDVCVDEDENIYVAQWASGKVYPYQLKRV